MNKLEIGAHQAVENCMKVKPSEAVVIIASRETDKISRFIEQAVLKVTPHVRYFIMEDFGQRPLKMPAEILAALKKADVSFYTGTSVEGELKPFRRPIYALVKKTGLRHAAMMNLSRTIMEQGMNADYGKVKEFSKRVFNILKGSKVIEVYTKAGTELKVRVGKYKWAVSDGDIRPGRWSNLPAGEVFTAPEDVEGRVVIDGVLGCGFDNKYGLLAKNPVSVEIKGCRAVTLKCRKAALEQDLQRFIFREGCRNSNRVGEFALGTNIYLKKLIGKLIQDEKFPSAHIAFGNCCPDSTGCRFTCDYHIDGVILKPTVIVDGFKLMDAGKYTI